MVTAVAQQSGSAGPAPEKGAVPLADGGVAGAGATSEIAALRMTDAERVAVVRRVMGAPPPGLTPFPEGIRKVVAAKHAAYVQPLIDKHWPESLAERAGKKLRFLTCQLYATSAYTVLFSSAQPPWPVAFARSIGSGLGLAPSTLSRVAGAAVHLVSATLPEITEKRIILIAAFIATVDHVYDHCFDGVEPTERGRRMHGLLNGTWLPDPTDETTPHAGAFRLVRGLQDEMSAGIDDADDRHQFDRAVDRLRDYVDAEVKAMTGVPDPSGAAWRMAGVLGTIDGLIFPVWRFAGEKARQWMYDCSLFIQILDDFLDAEKDLGEIRPTPVLSGHWTEATLAAAWQKSVDGIVELAKERGSDDESWLVFVKETYRMMLLETAEAMGVGGAA